MQLILIIDAIILRKYWGIQNDSFRKVDFKKMMQDGVMSHFQKVCLKTRTIDSFFKLQKYILSLLS